MALRLGAASVVAGGHIVLSSEDDVHVFWVFEAAGAGDGFDGHVGFSQEAHGSFELDVSDFLLR